MLEKCSCRYTVNNVCPIERENENERIWRSLEQTSFDEKKGTILGENEETAEDETGKEREVHLTLHFSIIRPIVAPKKNVGAAKGTAIVCLLCFICSPRSFPGRLP